jgi:cystathionine beta-lyase/cystathionine gamma-synthase
MAIATYLESHPKVEAVGYPGLASFPQHELAKKQASGFGAMVWFEVEGGVEAGKKLMDSLELWSLAENLGAVESLVTHPATMTHSDVEESERRRVGITDGLVRLSAGLEDIDDLLEDLDQGLARL